MKNLLFTFLTLISLLICTSCSLHEMNGEVTIKATVASCCNPWDNFESNSDNLEVIIDGFLVSEGISTKEVKIEDTGVIMLCTTCCGCPEGKEVFIKIKEHDLKKALDLGFEEA